MHKGPGVRLVQCLSVPQQLWTEVEDRVRLWTLWPTTRAAVQAVTAKDSSGSVILQQHYCSGTADNLRLWKIFGIALPDLQQFSFDCLQTRGQSGHPC